MHYYIDGYNLLFRVYGPKDYQLQAQRAKLIDTLREKIQFLNLNATLVFDSHYFEGDESRIYLENFAIVFTRQGETADEYILAQLEMASHPKQEVVVTSDKQLGAMVRRCGAKTEMVEEFIQWLHHRFRKKRQQTKTIAKAAVTSKPLHRLWAQTSNLKPEGGDIFVQKQHSPEARATPEQSFDYYLAEFEKRLQAEETQPKKKTVNKPIKKSIKSPKLRHESTDNPLSEMERWQRLFESKMEKANGQSEEEK